MLVFLLYISLRLGWKKSLKIRVRIYSTKILLLTKFEIDFFEFLDLFKVNFISRDSSECEKLINVIYFGNRNNYYKNYAENLKLAEIT